jgi:hypothetical protein
MRWRVRVRRVRGEPHTDIDRFIFSKSLPANVRAKGPPPWSEEWRRWIATIYFVESQLAKHRMAFGMFVGLTLDQRRFAERGIDRVAFGEQAVQRWGDEIATMVGEHPMIVYGLETTRAGEREVPALVAFPDENRMPATRAVQRAWPLGHARVRRFRPGPGGPAYVTKLGNWGLTFGCPRKNACRRRSGCRWKGKRLHPPTT